MRTDSLLLVALFASLLILSLQAKTMDPYKVLEVDRKASQRDIQKAFHKLSLKYHPDKNKSKGAQEKFAEINNAYEILSDEEKRKNYDMYGDEKGNPGFGGGNPGDYTGHSYFTSGGQAQNGFNFRPGEWQNMGGDGGQGHSFSFSYGGDSSPFSFGMGDLFSGMFGNNLKSGGQSGGFGGSTRSHHGSKNSPKSMKDVKSTVFKKEIDDQGMTWVLLSYTPSLKGIQYFESVIEEVASSLQGAMKVGSINCESEPSLCKDLNIIPRKAPRVFAYSYKASDKGSLVEYNGDLVAKSLKTFCQEHLPRFSKRVNLNDMKFAQETEGKLPNVLLLSTKKDTPVIWRALSGLYHKRFNFYDARVEDVSDSGVKKLGVDALPAIVGWLSNGDRHVLRTGISVKDLKSAVQDLSNLLDNFEKKNKKSGSSQATKPDSGEKIPSLTASNFDVLCGDSTPVCIIGIFRSAGAKEKLESVLHTVSQKSLTRRQTNAFGSRESVQYTLLDASKHPNFLNAFDKSGFKSSDKFLLAYKPRRGKFAALTRRLNAESAERFIGDVISGDLQFTKTWQKPVLK